MYKRLWCILFAVGLAGILTMPAAAFEELGQIRIQQTCAGEPVSGGTVSIRHVGTAMEDGYLIFGKTQNWIIAADEMFFPETALLVRKHTKNQDITVPADDFGVATFADLPEGVYLVTQTEAPEGYAPFAPFLIEIPIDGNIWQAEACPNLEPLVSDNPQTGDHPAPIIAAMTLVLSIFAVFTLSDKYKK